MRNAAAEPNLSKCWYSLLLRQCFKKSAGYRKQGRSSTILQSKVSHRELIVTSKVGQPKPAIEGKVDHRKTIIAFKVGRRKFRKAISVLSYFERTIRFIVE